MVSFGRVVVVVVKFKYSSCDWDIYRSVFISGCWNRGVPLYTEVSSFQGVGIEEFHCIQGYPHFRVLE